MEWTRRLLSLGCYVNRLVPCFFFPFGKEKAPKESGKVCLFFLITLFLVEKYYMFTVKSIEKESFKNNYS